MNNVNFRQKKNATNAANEAHKTQEENNAPFFIVPYIFFALIAVSSYASTFLSYILILFHILIPDAPMVFAYPLSAGKPLPVPPDYCLKDCDSFFCQCLSFLSIDPICRHKTGIFSLFWVSYPVFYRLSDLICDTRITNQSFYWDAGASPVDCPSISVIF